MVDYTGLKVAELKDLLKQRGLGVSGTKAELVGRLEESDSKEEPIEETAEKQESPSKDIKSTTTTTKPKEESKNPSSKETSGEESNGKDDSSETAEVIEELKKRMKRNERFGAEDQNEEIKRQIARIEKFGLDYKQAIKVLQPKLGDKNKIHKDHYHSKNSNTSSNIIVDEETARRRKQKFGA